VLANQSISSARTRRNRPAASVGGVIGVMGPP
jgi:hypothetical protein